MPRGVRLGGIPDRIGTTLFFPTIAGHRFLAAWKRKGSTSSSDPLAAYVTYAHADTRLVICLLIARIVSTANDAGAILAEKQNRCVYYLRRGRRCNPSNASGPQNKGGTQG